MEDISTAPNDQSHPSKILLRFSSFQRIEGLYEHHPMEVGAGGMGWGERGGWWERPVCTVKRVMLEDLWILQASVPVMNNKHDELTVIRSIHSVTMSCPPFSLKCLVSSPSSFSDTDLCRGAQDCAMTLSASRNFYKTPTFLQAWNERVFRFCSTSPSSRELGRCYHQLKENVKNSLTRARDCPLESR